MVHAQSIATGNIAGHVTSDGQPVGGATVVATSPALQGKRSTISNANGDFTLPSLPPGQYTLAVTLEGLAPQNVNVAVAGAQQATVDVKMGTAAVAETISVTAQA